MKWLKTIVLILAAVLAVDATAAQQTAVIDLSAVAARRAGPYLGGLLIGAVSFSR